jgi:hypothetical protein
MAAILCEFSVLPIRTIRYGRTSSRSRIYIRLTIATQNTKTIALD